MGHEGSLFKTTIVVWSPYDPTGQVETSDLIHDAEEGASIITRQVTVEVAPAALAGDADATEEMQGFFDINTGAAVETTISSDDGEVTVVVDAVPYLRQATDEELLALAGPDNEFGPSQATDDVSWFLAESVPEVDNLLDYCTRQGNDVGYTVRLDPAAAQQWITTFRPAVGSTEGDGGTSGQNRDGYTDDQDRDDYTVSTD